MYKKNRLHFIILLVEVVKKYHKCKIEKKDVSLCLYQILNPNAFSACSRANLPYMHYSVINDSFERAPWNVCFWLPKERLSQGCPVRGIGDKCLLVIGRPTHLSSNIHAGDLGDFRGCRDIGYSPISLALGWVVNVWAKSRLQKNSAVQGCGGRQETSPLRYRAVHLNFWLLLILLRWEGGVCDL